MRLSQDVQGLRFGKGPRLSKKLSNCADPVRLPVNLHKLELGVLCKLWYWSTGSGGPGPKVIFYIQIMANLAPAPCSKRPSRALIVTRIPLLTCLGSRFALAMKLALTTDKGALQAWKHSTISDGKHCITSEVLYQYAGCGHIQLLAARLMRMMVQITGL